MTIRSVLLLLTIACFGCHRHTAATRPHSASPSAVKPYIVLTKGPCMGTCPVYALTIYADGRVMFSPRFFTLESDTAYVCWRMEEISEAFEKADWSSLQESYHEGISDIPTYTLSYLQKKVTWNARAPKVLYDLMALLDRYTAAEGWIESTVGEEEGTARPGELLIQLRAPEALEALLGRHTGYDLNLIRTLDPAGRYVLVSFNDRIITAAKLMALLGQDEDVTLVSRNREIHPRED